MRRAGLVGLCACLGPRTGAAQTAAVPAGSQSQDAKRVAMAQEWISFLLPSLAACDRDHVRRGLKSCSRSHYDALGMDATVERFRGRLDEFLDYLRKEWSWVIRYDRDRGLLEVDENKNACVCPLVAKAPVADLGFLCYCSEGFAERLFSAVSGSAARAEVAESILRGQTSCKYRIELGPPRE